MRTTTAYGPANAGNATMVANEVTNTGGSQGHNNMQPYTVLNIIIALTGNFPAEKLKEKKIMADPYVGEIKMFGEQLCPAWFCSVQRSIIVHRSEHGVIFASGNDLRRRWTNDFRFAQSAGQGGDVLGNGSRFNSAPNRRNRRRNGGHSEYCRDAVA